MVHDLQLLNTISIRNASVPPILDEFVESFAGCKIYTVLDIHGGYDQRELDESSQNMTTFHTPLGPHCLTWLPQVYTNAVADHQNTMSFLLQDKIPDVAGKFIDDVGIKGDLVPIDNPNWMDEHILANPEIRAFVQKHAQDVNRVFCCIACSGETFSAKKTQIAMPKVLIVLAYDHVMCHMSGICWTYLIGMFRCLVSLLHSPAVEVQGPVFLVVLLILMYSGVARAHGTPGRYLSIVFPSGRACAHGTPASQVIEPSALTRAAKQSLCLSTVALTPRP
jgi:hypothetical protein